MKKEQIEIAAKAAGSFPITEPMESNSLFTRREMLGLTGMAGMAALTGIAPDAVAQTAQKRPRIACLVSFWGRSTSHADWIVNKLLDGYWWKGAHTPSRVDVVSAYIHELQESGASIVNIHSGQPDQRRVIEFYATHVLPKLPQPA